MSKRERSMGSDATVLQGSSEIISSDAAEMMPERSNRSRSVKTEVTVCPTESEIATVAYQLWLARGRPVGLDQEDWFLAEELLRNAPVVKYEDLSNRTSSPRRDTIAEYEMVTEFEWVGHWEVWESEWAGARWVLDGAKAGLHC